MGKYLHYRLLLQIQFFHNGNCLSAVAVGVWRPTLCHPRPSWIKKKLICGSIQPKRGVAHIGRGKHGSGKHRLQGIGQAIAYTQLPLRFTELLLGLVLAIPDILVRLFQD